MGSRLQETVEWNDESGLERDLEILGSQRVFFLVYHANVIKHGQEGGESYAISLAHLMATKMKMEPPSHPRIVWW